MFPGLFYSGDFHPFYENNRIMKKAGLLLCICAILSFFRPDSGRAAIFDITYTGFSDSAETAFAYAASIWENILVSDVPIRIHAHMAYLFPGQLGITFPNGVMNFAGGPQSNVWYATSLANAMSGTDITGGAVDMDIYFNIIASWYWGTDGLVPAGKSDFVTSALHEICHGLGFLSLSNLKGSKGSFGLIDSTSFTPLTTSFPWPQLDSLPSDFDLFLIDSTDIALTSQVNPSVELGDILTSGAVFFNGSNAMAANGGIAVPLYAPAAFVLGSSISHLDEASFPPGDPNELMTPSENTGNSIHDPGPITRGILKDLGWQLNDVSAVSEIAPGQLHIFPDPAGAILQVEGCGSQTSYGAAIYAVNGNLVKTFGAGACKGTVLQFDVHDLAPGVYILSMLGNRSVATTPFIKE